MLIGRLGGGAFSKYRGRSSKYMALACFLRFLHYFLPLNGRLVMIPDAAVSHFDKRCLSQKFGASINCRGSMGHESEETTI